MTKIPQFSWGMSINRPVHDKEMMMNRSCENASISRARQEIFDALRFLNPTEAERILRELAEDMKKLADRYDRLLEEAVCG